MSRFLATVFTLVLVALPASLYADGLYLNGVSPRSIGRGGTNQGFADNGGIIFDNPAAMTNIDGHGLFDASIDVLITDFEYSDPQNSRVTDLNGTPLPQVSGIYKTSDGQFAFGLGLFVPAGFSEEFDMVAPAPFMGTQHYESYGSLIKVLPAVAWQATDRLSIGGTLGVAYSQVELRGPYYLQSLGGFPTQTDLSVDGYAVTGSVGLQYKATNTTTLGLTWQSQTSMNLNGNSNIVIGPGLQANYDTDLRVKWPQSLAFGVRQQIATQHVVAADVTWYNWGDSFDNYRIDLSSPDSPFFPPSVQDPLPLQWNDTVSLRLGYEYDLGANRTIRLGYVYHPTPIPNSTLTPFIQAITEHAVSCGYGFRVWDWNVDLAYMYTTGETQRVGSSAFLGGDFDNSTHKAQTHGACVSLIRYF